jgi:hypothetical protein
MKNFQSLGDAFSPFKRTLKPAKHFKTNFQGDFYLPEYGSTTQLNPDPGEIFWKVYIRWLLPVRKLSNMI